ncbi:ABC-2 type transport system ATP-binding protein [Alicyclobacillus sacchari]|uniref:ABC-2 type transport system ATP-binding protein n=1 Tax=Alicyclobacillus sacchari TaxID=392010 RepID=A0A4R8LR96_9BACL|nr:ABC transporter ATP-binding protein [Alicyclobacillus sacchari]TDY48063.1 ABC-2 type transport system ATP-binding protein [Alicyclobacillus sacchari]GMA56212.1 ABC transporter ATP-binding protein [Alicyclobacillus sacchari]
MILTQNLCKRYGKMAAVQDMNLSIAPGTVFGLVGENGAGKTTALSMLATLSTPTSGRAYIHGFEVTREPRAVRRCIGYMPDAFGVYDDLTVMEYLRFFADCYRVDRRLVKPRADDLLERVRLTDKRDTYVNALSRGMQQRLEIARCLMHDPAVLILDEPSSGLDPKSRLEMRAVLHGLRDMGKTVLISTHILNELAEVADEVGILRRGELVAVAAVQVMVQHSSAYRTIHIDGRFAAGELERALASDRRVVDVHAAASGWDVLYAGTLAQQADLLTALVEQGMAITQFSEQPTDIEQLFLRLSAIQEGM